MILLTIVIPCLNEEETIARCIEKCFTSLKNLKIKNQSEIIVADNGSTDDSVAIAKKKGAKVILVGVKGYGSAIIQGVMSAKGKYVIIGDADDSYNFLEIKKIYKKLIIGFDLVQGCRFPSGGGRIKNNAMPWSHRYIGNPFFSFLTKVFFSLKFNDVYCGFRGFNRAAFIKLNHFSQGMVFAIENLIKFCIAGYSTTEVPITLYKDGRKKNKSHLKTFSDGWKTLRFVFLCCPKWLYFVPSVLFLIIAILQILYIFINFENLLVNQDILENIIIFIFFFFLFFQIFMFGLFSSLKAESLGLYRSIFIKKFFYIFKLRYALMLSLSIGCVAIYNLINYSFIANNDVNFIIFIFISLFSILLFFNSLFISLLTIEK